MRKKFTKTWSRSFRPRTHETSSSVNVFTSSIGRHKKTLLAVLFLFLYSTSVTFAVPPSGGYTPGATLDPDCAPGETDCIVAFTGGSVTLPVAISDGGTGGITAIAARANLGVSYATALDLNNSTTIAAWGDSLTDGYTVSPNYPTYLSAMTGYSMYNGGVTAEVSQQIRDRMLADTAKHGWPTIIWAGRNNYSNPTQVKSDIAAMVAALGHERYLVLSILNGSVSNEYQGQADYNAIISLNNDLETIYGDHYIDLRSYLVSQYDPGISQDVIDHGRDVPPSSLRFDYLHLNAAGYELVAQQIAAHIDVLQPNSTQSVLTPTRALDMFAAPPVIGAVTPNIAFFSSIGIGTKTPAFAFDTAAGAKYGIGGAQMVYLPDQDDLNGSIVFGNGGNSLSHSSGNEGRNNTLVGINAGLQMGTGFNNSVFGHNALYSNSSGTHNSVFGEAAMVSNSTGSYNVAMGQASLYSNNTGNYNVGVGVNALNANNSGSNNIAVGAAALAGNIGGSDNMALGNSSMVGNTSGGHNVGVGGTSLYSNATGGYNVGIGFSSLFSNTGGYNNVAIGGFAGYNATGSDNIFIGARAGYNETGAGKLYIANSDTATPLIYGDFSSSYLRLNGNVGVGTTGAPNARLDILGAALDTTVVRISTSGGNACSFSTSTGVFSCASDSRLKHDIVTIEATDALDKLLELKPVTYKYNWQESGEAPIPGFIAQEFETIFPDMVSTDSETGYKSLSYAPLMPYVVKGIQELDLKIAVLPQYEDETFTIRLADFFKGIAERGEALIASVITDRVETKELCVDDVCVSRAQFRAMVENAGQAPNVQTEETETEQTEEEVVPESETPSEGTIEESEEVIPENSEEAIVPEETETAPEENVPQEESGEAESTPEPSVTEGE